MINSKIINILEGFRAGGETVPVAFACYAGPAETYITFQETDAAPVYRGDDRTEYIAHYVDFDIFTKGNYSPIAEALEDALEKGGGRLILSNCSGDLFEPDTGYYHKTLAFEFVEYVGE